MTNPNDAVRMLLRRAQSQLLKWANKYGENNPSWLPPAGDVGLLEDMAEFIATANVQAEEVPAHPAQGDAELSDGELLTDAEMGIAANHLQGIIAQNGGSPSECADDHIRDLLAKLPLCRLQSPASVDAQKDTCGRNCPAGSHTVASIDEMSLDAFRFRWLTEDHQDAYVLERCLRIINSMAASSYGATCANINEALEEIEIREHAIAAQAALKDKP